MALQGLRDSTHDVDTVSRISASIRAAAEEVARTRGFEPDWLNDRAAGFAPVGLDEDRCEVFYEHPRLRVLGPPVDYVFLMKLYAARGGPDHDDMVALWPRCSFTSADDAATRFADAYPYAPSDPHLAEYITEIEKRSRGRRLSVRVAHHKQRSDARGLDTARATRSPDQSAVSTESGVQTDSPPPSLSAGRKVLLTCGNTKSRLVIVARRFASSRGLVRPGA